MKTLLLCLLLTPTLLLAQETHREATADEKKVILPEGTEKSLKEMGMAFGRDVERNIMRSGLIEAAMKNGKLDSVQMDGFVQKLTDHGLSKDDINKEIDSLSREYFGALQIRDESKIMTDDQRKERKARFDELQKLADEDKLTHDELDREISKLDSIISSSPVTIDNEKKQKELKAALLKAASARTFVKAPEKVQDSQFSSLKIMVPKDFDTSKFSGIDDPLCLKDAVSKDSQIDQLNKYMKKISGTSDEKDKSPLFKKIYFSWGYNRNYHSNTDVKFTTPEGSFTIHNTVGKDRPSKFDVNTYFNPARLSIPQYNMELGAMFNDKWGIELKQDHMKLVFDNTRPYEITGDYSRQVVIADDISNPNTSPTRLVDFAEAKSLNNATFMRFEHSDGYNYVSLGAVYNQNLYKTKNNKFAIDARFGAGAGLMVPKTKVDIHEGTWGNYRGLDNKFHIAGGGVHGEAKLRFTLWDSVYLQASTRGTYIKVKDALVDGTGARMEHIQPIGSVQFIGQIGYQYTIDKKKKKKAPASTEE